MDHGPCCCCAALLPAVGLQHLRILPVGATVPVYQDDCDLQRACKPSGCIRRLILPPAMGAAILAATNQEATPAPDLLKPDDTITAYILIRLLASSSGPVIAVLVGLLQVLVPLFYQICGTLAHHDTLAHATNMRKQTCHMLCDNTPSVAWQRKGLTSTLGPAIYLLWDKALHVRTVLQMKLSDGIKH
jgi:hypothetical protein